MERFITDERTGLKYELVGDYPNPSHRSEEHTSELQSR